MHYTAHARARVQQRSIPQVAIEALLEFGHERRRGGASVLFMDRAARQRAADALGRRAYARLAPKLDSYLVVADDGLIVTAVRRLKRLRF